MILKIAPSGCSYVLPACLQYYHESCPLGWEEHQIDDACIAPESYEGSQTNLGFVLVMHLAMAGVCAKAQSFRGATRLRSTKSDAKLEFVFYLFVEILLVKAEGICGSVGAMQISRTLAASFLLVL